LEAIEGEDDHVHLRVCYPPKVALSTLVNSLNGASSRLIRKQKAPGVHPPSVGRAFLVAELMRRKLRRRPACDHQEMCRTAAGTGSEQTK